MLEEYALKILPIRKLLVDVYSNLDAEYTVISFSKVDELNHPLLSVQGGLVP